MSRTPRATPSKTLTKQKPCENVEEELCTRAFSLLVSLYEEHPSTKEILTFPPAKKVTLKKEKPVPFHSSIADLRLLRSEDQRQKTLTQVDENIAQRIADMTEVLKSSPVNLDEIFMPEEANRPEIPKYLQNQNLDEKLEQELYKRKGYHPMKMQEIQKEYTKRLDSAQKKGIERAKRRAERFTGGKRWKSPYQSKFAENAVWREKENREKRLQARKSPSMLGIKMRDENIGPVQSNSRNSKRVVE